MATVMNKTTNIQYLSHHAPAIGERLHLDLVLTFSVRADLDAFWTNRHPILLLEGDCADIDETIREQPPHNTVTIVL